MEHLPFITGSHAYGTPKPGSDIDLVVLVSEGVKRFLLEHTDSPETCRFGDLNLVLCTTVEEYQLWQDARELCKKRKPCSTKRARAIHDVLRMERDVEAKYKESD